MSERTDLMKTEEAMSERHGDIPAVVPWLIFMRTMMKFCSILTCQV